MFLQPCSPGNAANCVEMIPLQIVVSTPHRVATLCIMIDSYHQKRFPAVSKETDVSSSLASKHLNVCESRI